VKDIDMSDARVTSNEDVKPKKDWWDKAVALSTAIAAILVAIIGGNITIQTGKIQESIATQNTGKDYVQIALNILEKKDVPPDMQKNIGLRKWAVGLLKYYSPVNLDEPTADKLITGEVEIPVVHGNILQDFPWNAKDTITIRAPHAGPFASINTDGVVRLEVQGGYIVDQTEIKSPKALFSEDGADLIVYNNQKAVIYFTRPDTIRQRLIPPLRISPPNGISGIGFNKDGNIVVISTDKKQILYDYDGNEIKQE
jgi:hypothetical protein